MVPSQEACECPADSVSLAGCLETSNANVRVEVFPPLRVSMVIPVAFCAIVIVVDSDDWLRLRSIVQVPEKSGFGAVVDCDRLRAKVSEASTNDIMAASSRNWSLTQHVCWTTQRRPAARRDNSCSVTSMKEGEQWSRPQHFS